MQVHFEGRDDAAVIVAVVGEQLTLRASWAAAPGTPLRGAFADGQPIEVKVRRSRRVDGDFLITGRCINLTRKLRDRFASELSPDA